MVKSKWIKKAKINEYINLYICTKVPTYITFLTIVTIVRYTYQNKISGSFGYDEMTLIKNNLIGLTFYWIRKLHQVPSLQIPRIVY